MAKYILIVMKNKTIKKWVEIFKEVQNIYITGATICTGATETDSS